jgi:hypothetical protein
MQIYMQRLHEPHLTMGYHFPQSQPAANWCVFLETLVALQIAQQLYQLHRKLRWYKYAGSQDVVPHSTPKQQT